jgi:hypothetical protein
MSDDGKAEKPRAQLPPKQADPESEPTQHPPVPTRWSEILYRATGGKEGTAPLSRVMGHRQAIGASVLQRAANMRAIGGAADIGGGEPKVPEGTGAPLAGEERARMEPKLGADLSAVGCTLAAIRPPRPAASAPAPSRSATTCTSTPANSRPALERATNCSPTS